MKRTLFLREPIGRGLVPGLVLSAAWAVTGQEPGTEPCWDYLGEIPPGCPRPRFALKIVPLEPAIHVVDDESVTTWLVPTRSVGSPIPLSLGVVLSIEEDSCSGSDSPCGGIEKDWDACRNDIDDDLDGAMDTFDPDCHGPQGWSFSVEATRSRVQFMEATTGGTIADFDTSPPGIKDSTGGSLDRTEVVLEPTGAGRHGAISAVVLSFVGRMLPLGDHLILRIDAVIDRWPPYFPDDEIGLLKIPSSGEQGLRAQNGQRVLTVITAGGNSHLLQAHEVTIHLTDLGLPGTPAFIRGDANDDRKVNVADCVWILGGIFLGGPPSSCPAAADANADEIIDLSDAVFILRHQFEGGSPPPAPYPECGRVESSNEDCGARSCEEAP